MPVEQPREDEPGTMRLPAPGERIRCGDCGEEITGNGDGTGQPYCHECGEGKDDEHWKLISPSGLPVEGTRNEAVEWARRHYDEGAHIFLSKCGGTTFDRLVRAEQ